MIIAVDFDGVLHDYKNPVKGRRMGAPIEDAQASMVGLYPHAELIIFSTRGGSPEHIADWMKYYEIPYHSITNIKPNADVFIDDKGIRFETWEQTLFAMGVDL